MNKYELTKREYCEGKVVYIITCLYPYNTLAVNEDEAEIMKIWNRLKKFGGEYKETTLEQI